MKKVVDKLGLTNALKIVKGDEKLNGEYVIFTYTTGFGKTPKAVEAFLAANPGVKAKEQGGGGNDGSRFRPALFRLPPRYDCGQLKNRMDSEI